MIVIDIPKKILYAVAAEIVGKLDLFDLNDAEKHAMAIEFYRRGYVYRCSSFDDMPTYGYGQLDNYGFFEYPLYEKDIKPGLNKLGVLEMEKNNVG